MIIRVESSKLMCSRSTKKYCLRFTGKIWNKPPRINRSSRLQPAHNKYDNHTTKNTTYHEPLATINPSPPANIR